VYKLLVAVVLIFVLILLFCSCATHQKNFIFTHPSKGYFSFQPPNKDPWYWVPYNEYLNAYEPPEKWCHYMGPYSGALLLNKKIGKFRTATLLLSITFIGEFNDGYREGWSVRDTFMELLGISAGLFNQKLICTWNQSREEIRWTYYRKIPWW